MTTDNQKKYEEAAGQYASNRENLYNHIEINAIEAFKAGASFAEKDGWNAAIDRALECFTAADIALLHTLHDDIKAMKV